MEMSSFEHERKKGGEDRQETTSPRQQLTATGLLLLKFLFCLCFKIMSFSMRDAVLQLQSP